MSTQYVINVDLVDVWSEPGRKGLLRTLGWGDKISVARQTDDYVEIETIFYDEQDDGSILPVKQKGYIEPAKSSRRKVADIIRPIPTNDVLKVNFVDVQQGDAAVIESPDGKVILVDGGDNQLFARYLAGRFRETTADDPMPIECLLVTHGDADHFAGLNEIYKSETNEKRRKRFFMQPKRYYHNGIVKRPGKKKGKSVPDVQLLGPTKKSGDKLFLTGLEQNLLQVPDGELNAEFLEWKKTLQIYDSRLPIEFRRIQFGDNKAFEFFNQGSLRIEVLGPITEEIDGKPALPFLHEPPKGPRLNHDSLSTEAYATKSALSASHTINGHSIVFRLEYGGFSYLFTGDINDETSRLLTAKHEAKEINLRSEILKTPHHGSHEFSGALLQAVSPVVSVISCGDENARKEFIHPRATLVGALGKYSRMDEPLIFITELVAFFKTEGWSQLTDPKKAKTRKSFFGFSRTAYGLIKTRTDGKRLLVYTDSGNMKMKEAYAYVLNPAGAPVPSPVLRV